MGYYGLYSPHKIRPEVIDCNTRVRGNLEDECPEYPQENWSVLVTV